MMLILRLACITVATFAHRRSVIARFVRSEAGQDLLEYALLAAFVGVAGFLALSVIDDAVGFTYSTWLDPTAGAPSLWAPAEPLSSGS